MARPDRAGTFRAQPVEWGIAQVGGNKLATFVVRYHLTEWLDDGGAWVPWGDYHHDITGYHFLEKRDGAANGATIRQIREALGWDGLDLAWLNQSDHTKTIVQLVLEYEEWEGDSRLKVKWLNAGDYEGGALDRADEAALRDIAARLDSKLRSLVTAKPAGAGQATTAASPAPPPVSPAPLPPTDAAGPRRSTCDTAWNRLCQCWGSEKSGDELADYWGQLIRERGKPERDFAPEDWGAVEASAEIPF